jgi:hypothetical protein
VKELILYLHQQSGQEQFVLTHPDILSDDDIIVDEEGRLTVIIGWDGVRTVPDFLGYIRFPSWITRDWEPEDDEDRENPEDTEEGSGKEEDQVDSSQGIIVVS